MVFYLTGVHVELWVEFADWRPLVSQGFPVYVATFDPLSDGAKVLAVERGVLAKKPKSNPSQRYYLILREF